MNVTASPIHVSSAMTYSSTYKGSGRGYVHMTSSAQVRSIGSAGGGMAQAPVAAMSSTSSSYSSRGIAQTSSSIATPQLSCIRTSASAISGGVTTYDEGPRKGHLRKGQTLPPGACPNCDWHYDDATDTWYCPYCDCDPYDDCDHVCVPIGDGKEVWLFVTALAGVYALYKARARKEQLI